jgi:hypothetical protein
MQSDGEAGLRRIVVAIAGALVAFCVFGVGMYYEVAHVSANGWVYRGPTALTAAMAGLFGGGFAAMLVLILLLRRR